MTVLLRYARITLAILAVFLSFEPLASTAFAADAPASAKPVRPEFARGSLSIQTRTQNHRFNVEVATSRQQQHYGLMYTAQLAPDYGMLFVWPQDTPVSMWMKNTLIPLDMLFIDGQGAIVHIARNTTPGSTDTISAERPVRAVLELAGGSADARGIAVGDKVSAPEFGL